MLDDVSAPLLEVSDPDDLGIQAVANPTQQDKITDRQRCIAKNKGGYTALPPTKMKVH
jgi:hypothetical protein